MTKRVMPIIWLIILFLWVLSFFDQNTYILGGDWWLPLTDIQFKNFTDLIEYTWINNFVSFGERNSVAFSQTPFVYLLEFISFFDIERTKFVFAVSLFFPFLSFFYMLRYFKVNKNVALLWSLFYVTTPLFFNYIIMWWNFVLMFLWFLPIWVMYFIKGNKERNNIYIVLTWLIFAVSILQSQSFFWFMIVFLILGLYLVENKKTLIYYVKSIVGIMLIFLIVNSYWLVWLFFYKDPAIAWSSMINSSVSLGTSGHFKPINIIRLWWPLYNYQYESIFTKSDLIVLSFILPIIVFASLFVPKRKKLIMIFWLISIMPIVLYLFNLYFRDILLSIPYSNVLRDFARFTVLSSFGYLVLLAFVLDYFWVHKNVNYRKIWYICAIFMLISIRPWYTGKIINWQDGIWNDIRIRTKQIPKAYSNIEQIFAKKLLDQKSLYIPLRWVIDFEDDIKFHGMYKEVQDVFAVYSPIPWPIYQSDRSQWKLKKFIKLLNESLETRLVQMLESTNVKYIVVRKNLFYPRKWEIIEYLKKQARQGKLKIFYNNWSIIVYENIWFVPHIYIPVSKKKLIDTDNFPVIEYKKINSTKYKVVIHNAKWVFPLIFWESFHNWWMVYSTNRLEQNSKKDIFSILDNYKIVGGNEKDQATSTELIDYIKKWWIDGLKDEDVIWFVSKNKNNTIQNNNLKDGVIWDTWFEMSFLNETHTITNWYANSWILDINKICWSEQSSNCKKNQNNTYDLELIIEFWPQRLLYLWKWISFSWISLLIVYMFYYNYRQKKIKKLKLDTNNS